MGRVTGEPFASDDLRRVGERVTVVKKLFNQRQGWTRDLDTLPPRLLDGGGEDEGRPTRLSRAGLERMLDAYYAVRGWDREGRVPDERVAALGLECSEGPQLAKAVAERGGDFEEPGRRRPRLETPG